MRGVTFVTVTAAVLCGCAQPPAPQKLTGPVAHLEMTQMTRGNNGHDFFFLSKIDGQDFYQQHKGVDLSGEITTVVDIPARTARFTIGAHTSYPAPIFGITNPVYDLAGDTTLTPVADQTYVIKGTLGPDYSAVWIENAQTGEIVGTKIEAKGSASIGFFKKLVCNPNSCRN